MTTADRWARRLGALAVASVAACASYQHQRDFALAGGADLTTARLWPLSVDDLLVLSTAGLLRDGHHTIGRARHILRATFATGIIVSLAANIATAPAMTWAPILVAGWPPVALLLAVELVGHQRHRDAADHAERDTETRTRTGPEPTSRGESRPSRCTAEEVMWDHYQRKLAAGLPPPTGAELDQVSRTNNYGRAVLRKWRRNGRTHPPMSVDTAVTQARSAGGMRQPLTPAQRSLRAKAAADASWANTTDRTARTAPARRAALARFEHRVDPHQQLPEHERQRRAASARRSYFHQLALRSAQLRGRR